MANIIRRSEPRAALNPASQLFQPLRLARELLGWDPFGGVDELARGPALMPFLPAFDVSERNDAYVIEADLPGLRDENLEISVSGQQLVVRGEREQERRESDERRHLVERVSGSFVRSFVLPADADVDAIEARLTDGVLTVRLPKREGERSRRIAISGGSQQASGNGGRAQQPGSATEQPPAASDASTRKTGGNQ